MCHELLDLFFVINEANTFRQGKVVISKFCFFVLIKDALAGLHFLNFVLVALRSQRLIKRLFSNVSKY